MQFLTATETHQLKLTAIAAYNALELIEDAFCSTLDRFLVALTSDRAVAVYKTVWEATRYAVLLTAAAAFYSGVLTRQIWDRFSIWSNNYVEACTTKPVPALAPVPVPAPELVKKPRKPRSGKNTAKTKKMESPTPEATPVTETKKPRKPRSGKNTAKKVEPDIQVG